MNVTATTLPRRAASVTSRAVLRGQGEVGRRPDRRQPLLVLLVLGLMRRSAGHASSPSAMTSAARMAHAFSSRLSSLRKRQSVPSAMSCVGAGVDHAGLVQAQRVEAQRVLRVVLAPAVVGQLRQRLERVVVPLREPAIDQTLRGALRLGGAEVGGLEDRAQHALGRDRMLADEVAVARRPCSRSTATRAGPCALLTITWPILRARSSCGSGGKPRKASILPSANSSIGLAGTDS